MNLTYTTAPPFITNVWALRPYDIVNSNYHESTEHKFIPYHSAVVFCLVPHFFYEFANDSNVIYIDCSFSANPSIYNADLNLVCEYLKWIVKADTKICFSNIDEGNLLQLAYIVHTIQYNTQISYKKFYCVTSALNVEMYDVWCKTYNIPQRINVLGASSWEYHTKKVCIDNNFHNTIQYNIANKSKIFLFMNRVLRYHRFALFNLLSRKSLLNMSYTSFYLHENHENTDQSNVSQQFLDQLAVHLSNTVIFQQIREEFSKVLSTLPRQLNITAGLNKVWVDHDDTKYFDDSYFSLVTETFFFTERNSRLKDNTAIFFSEKIFKPIAMKHPFIIASRPHSLTWLKKLGYKTFHPWIDESYDTIEDDTLRLSAIVAEVERLSKFKDEQWLEWQKNIKSLVEHNSHVFYGKQNHDYAVVRATWY